MSRDQLVDRTVDRIRELCRSQTLDLNGAIGRLVVEQFYGGRIESWRRRQVGDPSFRSLSRHPQLPLSASALYRAVAIHELQTRIDVSNWKHLGSSHLRCVLGLPESDQRRLLESANTGRFSVSDLEMEASRIRLASKTSGRRPGRPRATDAMKVMRQTDEVLEAMRVLLELYGSADSATLTKCLPAIELPLQSALSRVRELLHGTTQLGSNDPA